MQGVDEFIEQLLQEKDITDLDPETRGELKKEMTERLLDQINKAAIMQLDEEKAAELSDLLDKEDFTNEKMAEFMENSGVDLTQVALETMLQFRNYYLSPEE